MTTYRPLPLPAHYRPAAMGEVYRVDYAGIAEAALHDARLHQIRPSAGDTPRIGLVIIDAQNTFCIPGFELHVEGAVADNQRLVEFLYRNLRHITTIIPTLDTHSAVQIFHPTFWVRGRGKMGADLFDVPTGANPKPHTPISMDDIAGDVWDVNPAIAASLGGDYERLRRHARHYVAQLARDGKFLLTVWPYHAMLGGVGHALVSGVEAAVFYHTIARSSQADFQIKGGNALTENYSVLRPEVLDGPDGISIGAQTNAPLIEKLLAFDAVIIAGQAKSHCVAWTIGDLAAAIQARDPGLARKVYLLEDCTSPVVVPGVVDFAPQADAAFGRFAVMGMHRVCSTEPLDTWLDLAPRQPKRS